MIFKPFSSLTFAAVTLCATASSPSASAATYGDLCPGGNVAVIRIDKIKPTGSVAGFEKAVADHAKWYADHGLTEDKIFSAPVLVYDEATKTAIKAPNQMMTFHMNSHGVPRDQHDAAWDAYVAEYRANSDIGAETVTCLPH